VHYHMSYQGILVSRAASGRPRNIFSFSQLLPQHFDRIEAQG
jgi:hypothetical protein